MLIFPPYAIYVAVFQLSDLIRRTQTLAGVPETPGLRQAALFLNPCLFCGLPFLGMIYQEASIRYGSTRHDRPHCETAVQHPHEACAPIAGLRADRAGYRRAGRVGPADAAGSESVSAAARGRPALSDVRHDARRVPVSARPSGRGEPVQSSDRAGFIVGIAVGRQVGGRVRHRTAHRRDCAAACLAQASCSWDTGCCWPTGSTCSATDAKIRSIRLGWDSCGRC